MRRSLTVVVLAFAVALIATGCKNKAPLTPTISGPDSVAIGDSATYTTLTTDPNKDRVLYVVDWQDGSSDTTELAKSGTAVSVTHGWNQLGTYYIRAKAKDEKGLYSAEWSDSLGVVVYYDSANPPVNMPPAKPTQPVVAGPLWKDSLLTISSSATDQDGDSIRITFYFGDPALSPYQSALVPSGATVSVDVRYPSRGTKIILAVAADTHGDTSVLSDPTTITLQGVNNAPYAPQYKVLPVQGIANGPAYRFYANAEDPDGDSVRLRFYFGATDSMTTGYVGSAFDAIGTWTPTGDTGVYPVRVKAIDPDGLMSATTDTIFRIVGPGQVIWCIGGDFVSSPAIGTMLKRGATQTAIAIGAKSYGSSDASMVLVDAYIGPDERNLLDDPLFDDFNSSPGIGSTGNVYIGNGNGAFYALTPACSVKWFFPDTLSGNDFSTTPIVDGNNIYFAGDDKALHKLVDNGATYTNAWRVSLHSEVTSSPVLGPDGNIIVCDDSGYVYSVSATGTTNWTLATGEVLGINSSPAIVSDGTAYVGTESGKLLAIKDNAIVWSWVLPDTARSAITSSPVIGTDGHIYFMAENGRMYNVNPGTRDIEPGWPKQITSNFAVTGTMVVFQGGFYLVDDDEFFYSVDASGNVVWSMELVVPFRSSAPRARAMSYEEQASPVIDQYGIIYVATQSGLFAICGPATNRGLAATDWPMFHHDVRHTGKFGARRR